jgi:hypothetical protein
MNFLLRGVRGDAIEDLVQEMEIYLVLDVAAG